MRSRDLSAWLLRGDHPAARLVRFGGVGAVASMVYAAVTALLIARVQLPPVAASVAGYCIAVPVSFMGHRGFSFRSRGAWTHEALRFAVTQAVNLAVTVAVMDGAVRLLQVSWLWGVAVTVVLIPLASFAAMQLWVFRLPPRARR